MAILFKDSRIAGTGKPGESAYDIAKKYGYEGTETDFAENLINAGNFMPILSEHNVEPTAHNDIRELIDTKIAAIPTPDVSGQIQTHNESEDAHPFIQGKIVTSINNHDANQDAHPFILGEIGNINTYIQDLEGTVGSNAITAKDYTDGAIETLTQTVEANAVTAAEYTDQTEEDIFTELTAGTTVVRYALGDESGNNILSTYETKSDSGNKLAEAKAYTDEVAAGVKNDLLNGAGEAYDTLKELGDLISTNTTAIDALNIVAASKVAQTEFDGHAGNVNNPHAVTAAQVGAPTTTDFTNHTGNKTNPHEVTAAQVGLGNVNNTADTDKPVSTAQATAIADAKAAGTAAQTNLTTHTGASNPHGITHANIGGVTAVANGGTGATTAEAALTALGAAAKDDLPFVVDTTIGTSWTTDSTTGAKYQTITVTGATAARDARVGVRFASAKTSAGFTEYANQRNQFNQFICNGFAETGEDTVTFWIFGDANTINIPITVEVI